MLFVNINNNFFFVKKNISILEACKFVGIQIPRFCYNESLSIAGNCRMCLVEIETISNKPVSSCTLLISEEMNILTDTPFVKKARENILESLLLSHPLDCPICDQAGECDLQDQVKIFGLKTSRYFFKKRVVEDKYLGSVVKTIMTRCIHCTRCVRFSTEILGKSFFGTLNRGQNTEIGTYTLNIFDSNLSGNVIDLCPVGALTSASYAFKARPWELKIKETIDLTDSLGVKIFVAIKGKNIIRILPKKDSNLNKFFITDKTRFSFDSLNKNRLLHLYKIKHSVISGNTITSSITWKNMSSIINSSVLNQHNTFLLSEDIDFEFLLKAKLIENTNSNFLKSKSFFRTIEISSKTSNIYLNNFYSSISKLDTLSISFCYILSSNLNLENVLINTKIRTRYLTVKTHIFSMGFNSFNVFPSIFISFSNQTLLQIFEAKNFFFKYSFLNSLNSCFLVGASFAYRFLKPTFFSFVKSLIPSCLFIVLNKMSNTESFTFLNIKSLNSNLLKKTINFFYLNIPEILFIHKIVNFTFTFFNKNNFWVSSHGPLIFKQLHYLIPTLTFFEKNGIYINLDGKAQKAYSLNLKSKRDVASLIDIILPFFFTKHIFSLSTFENQSVFFYFFEMLNISFFEDLYLINLQNKKHNNSYITFFQKYPFKPFIEDFYCTNTFTKNSINMSLKSRDTRKLWFSNFNN